MGAIEKITSQTKEIHLAGADPEHPTETIEVTVWNETVANLTLMALGEKNKAMMNIFIKNY